jgi:hypothetical protein
VIVLRSDCSDFASCTSLVVPVAAMAQRSAQGVAIVEVPSSASDAPSWARVGIVAALGFIVGVAWPRLAGVRLGPGLPEGAASAVVDVSATASASSTAAQMDLGLVPPPAAASPAVVPSTAEPVAPAILEAPPLLKAAEVQWEVALVREVAKTGKIIARLPRGTSVRVGPPKDGWYPVKYGSDFAGDGWVYRGAIGR